MEMQRPNETQKISRPLAEFHPDLWGDRFLNYTPPDKVAQSQMEQEAKELKELVRQKLLDVDMDPKERLVFLDDIHRLGVAYHFENEIDDSFKKFHKKLYNDSCYEDDLYYVSLYFRLLRQHGIYVSCDVFEKFKSEDGSFKESLASDVLGVLSLYEASFLRVHGEITLDEAMAFATTHLTSFATQLSSPMAEQITRALKLPVHRRSIRLESRHQISFYESKSYHDKNLLRFAKLDFNLLQILYNTELRELTRWWRNLDIMAKLPYVRDRVVEAYFWILGVYHEPKYSYARMISNKFFKLISIIDDTYDSYGTIDELRPFTEAVQRGDKSCINQLPYYMRVLYQIIQDMCEELKQDLAKEQRSYAVNYLQQQMKDTCQGYLREAEWRHNKFVPTFDEYIKNGILSSGYLYTAVVTFQGMGEIANKDAFEWVCENSKAPKASCIVGRLVNDICSHKIEESRGYVTTGLNCHMGQFGTSMEEATKELRSLVEEAWKDINEAIIGPTIVPMSLLTRAINLTRVLFDIYHDDEDGYTKGEFVKEQVETILIEPVMV